MSEYTNMLGSNIFETEIYCVKSCQTYLTAPFSLCGDPTDIHRAQIQLRAIRLCRKT